MWFTVVDSYERARQEFPSLLRMQTVRDMEFRESEDLPNRGVSKPTVRAFARVVTLPLQGIATLQALRVSLKSKV